MTAAVKQSVEIHNTTTLYQRMLSMFLIPINRRALGELLRQSSEAHLADVDMLYIPVVKSLHAVCKRFSSYAVSIRFVKRL